MQTSLPPPPSAASQPLAYGVYDLLGALATLLALPLLPFLALTRRREHLGERLGLLPDAVTALDRPVWIHAASVGEVLASEPLVRELRLRRSGLPIVVSTTSITGRATAADRLGVDAVMLLPVDLRWIITPVMRRIKPRGLVIVETELWPSLLRAAGHCRIPAIMVSGKISARSARRYAKAGGLVRAMLGNLSACLMQAPADAERIIALGADPARVQVVGSLKFARDAGTVQGRPLASALATQLAERPILVAASTHSGEEDVVLEAYRSAYARDPAAMLILAPRRPERFDDVAGLLQQRGLKAVRRSQLNGPVAADTQVLLLDTLGELLDFLPMARAVFVGGTIAPKVGGHNVLEPAVFGKPVAFGPQTSNVAGPAAALLDAGAATLVTTAAELGAEWTRLLDDAAVAQAMGERGREVVAAQADVARRTAELVCRQIDGAK